LAKASSTATTGATSPRGWGNWPERGPINHSTTEDVNERPIAAAETGGFLGPSALVACHVVERLDVADAEGFSSPNQSLHPTAAELRFFGALRLTSGRRG
jgi:hypothetical protein